MKKIVFVIITLLILYQTQAQDKDQIQTLLSLSRENMFSDPKKASALATEAIELFGENKMPDGERAYAMLLYSYAEELLGNFDLSISNLYETKKYIDPENKMQNGQLYMLMGRLFCKLGDFQRATDFNDKGTEIFRDLGDSIWVATCYNERGMLHYLKNEQDIAEQYLQRALQINRKEKNLKGIAMNLSSLCMYEGNTEEKLAFIKEAIAINKNLNAVWSLGENYNKMGRLYFFAEQYENALEALGKANEYAQQIGAKELICDNYEYYSMVYAVLKDYSKAFSYLEKMTEMSRELQSSNKLRNIENEIARKEQQEQEHAIQLREHEYRIESLQRNIWILACITILIIVGSFVLHRKDVTLQDVQGTLDDSRKETTSYAVFLRSRNELLDNISAQIKEGYKMNSAEIVPHLKRINAFIAQTQNEEKRNSTLLSNVEEKSDEFLKRLLMRHPNLTQGEKYLATMLRVNLSTKEIAMLTQNSPKTINMNRYRLRKSLGLAPEDNLIDYLKEI